MASLRREAVLANGLTGQGLAHGQIEQATQGGGATFVDLLKPVLAILAGFKAVHPLRIYAGVGDLDHIAMDDPYLAGDGGGRLNSRRLVSQIKDPARAETAVRTIARLEIGPKQLVRFASQI
jgi:hypothetical protein